MEEKWELLEEVAGSLQAEILKGYLEAQGIPVNLSQEGIRHVYPVTVGPLGRVQVLVPSSSLRDARQVLDDYYRGVYELPITSDESDDEDQEQEYSGE